MMLSYEGVISYRHTLCDSLAMCPGMFLQQDNSLMREGMGKKNPCLALILTIGHKGVQGLGDPWAGAFQQVPQH